MSYNNIPLEDWRHYPENKPKENGYYLTLYTNLKEKNQYYKCIYWNNKEQNWVTWRNPFTEGNLNFFKVEKFVEKTRTDFYCPCIEKVKKLYWNKK